MDLHQGPGPGFSPGPGPGPGFGWGSGLGHGSGPDGGGGRAGWGGRKGGRVRAGGRGAGGLLNLFCVASRLHQGVPFQIKERDGKLIFDCDAHTGELVEELEKQGDLTMRWFVAHLTRPNGSDYGTVRLRLEHGKLRLNFKLLGKEFTDTWFVFKDPTEGGKKPLPECKEEVDAEPEASGVGVVNCQEMSTGAEDATKATRGEKRKHQEDTPAENRERRRCIRMKQKEKHAAKVKVKVEVKTEIKSEVKSEDEGTDISAPMCVAARAAYGLVRPTMRQVGRCRGHVVSKYFKLVRKSVS